METVTVKYLRDNLAEIIDEAAIAKKSFVVTKFGKQKVAIVPIKDIKVKKKKVDFGKLPAFGMWKDREDMKDSAQWVSDLRKREEDRHLVR